MKLQIFRNTEFSSVRNITVDGELYFDDKEVVEILEYNNIRKFCPGIGGIRGVTVRIMKNGIFLF